MKRKILSILFTLVLVASFSLVTAVPVGAQVAVDSGMTTAEINMEIAGATSGETVQFADGIYDLTAPLVVGVAGVTLQGDTTTPSDVTINAPTGGVDMDCFQVKANNVTIQGFKMQGAQDAASGPGFQNCGVVIGTHWVGPPIKGVHTIDISHNEFVDCSKGIFMYHVKDSTVTYNTFTTTEGQVTDNFTDTTGWGGDAIHVYLWDLSDYPTGNIISHNIMDNVRVGVFLNGDHIAGTDPSAWDFSGTTIEDNTMTDVWNAGIVLQCASGTALSPIIININDINTSTGRRAGDEGNERGLISVHGDYTVITGNTLTNSEEHGLWVDGSHHMVEGNIVTFNTLDGIHVDAYKEVEPNNNWTLPVITRANIGIANNTLQNNTVQVGDPTEALDMQSVFDNNFFDQAVVVDHEGASLLHTIWSKIQDGVDAAVTGDTVIVAAGTYAEEITIGTANLTLQSESELGAIIRPTTTADAVVYINANSVTVDGFEIDGTTVCTTGILGWETSGLTITNNKIHGAVSAWHGCGILLFSWGNSGTVHDNLIEGNEVYDTGRMGIMVCDYDGANYTLTSNNVITGNTVYDVWKMATAWDDHGGGIQINVAKDCSITNNEVYNVQDGQRGIYMFGSADGNTITGNTLRENPIGIQLWISGEGGSPPIAWAGETATSPQVHFNNIYDNTDGAISTNIAGTPMVINAINNWWGAADGPSLSPGSGDSVSGNVDYDPWLLGELAQCGSECIDGDGTCSGTPTGGDVTIDAEGEHTITTAKYTGNPGGTPTFEASGNYYDVCLCDDTGVNSLTIEFCPADEDTVIYYWDETSSSWEPCSAQYYLDACIVVTVTTSTFPSLSDLTGTPFASGTPYRPSPTPAPAPAPSGGPVGGEVYPINKANMLAPWLSLALIIVIGGGILVIRRRTIS